MLKLIHLDVGSVINLKSCHLMRTIYGTTYNAHTLPLFKKSQILQLPELYHLHLGLFMHQLHHQTLPMNIINCFIPHQHAHAHNLRTAQPYRIPRSTSTATHNSIINQGFHLWTSITSTLKDLPYNKFKHSQKNILLSRY